MFVAVSVCSERTTFETLGVLIHDLVNAIFNDALYFVLSTSSPGINLNLPHIIYMLDLFPL